MARTFHAYAGILLAFSLAAFAAADEANPSKKAGAGEDFDEFVVRVHGRRELLLGLLKKERRDPTEKKAVWAERYTRSTFDASDGWILSSEGYVNVGKLIDMGKVEVVGDRIRLVSGSPYKPFPDDSATLELDRVLWGQRVYLVETGMMIDFCNAVNGGRLEFSGSPSCLFYSRDDDYLKKVSGRPAVPREYRQYLLEKVVKARVTKVNSMKFGVVVVGRPKPVDGISVVASAGSRDGIRPGMQFFFTDEKLNATAHVTAADANTSELLIESLPKGKSVHQMVGAQLSTRDPLYWPPPK